MLSFAELLHLLDFARLQSILDLHIDFHHLPQLPILHLSIQLPQLHLKRIVEPIRIHLHDNLAVDGQQAFLFPRYDRFEGRSLLDLVKLEQIEAHLFLPVYRYFLEGDELAGGLLLDVCILAFVLVLVVGVGAETLDAQPEGELLFRPEVFVVGLLSFFLVVL